LYFDPMTFDRSDPRLQWATVVILSTAAGATLAWLRVPAALLLGPMLAGITVGALGGSVRVPAPLFAIAQGIIACMVARMLPASLAGEIVMRWPVFLFGVAAVIGASVLSGWVMARMRLLPASAVMWGSFPGAATAMVVMSEAYGADARLVAFMKYLRVAMVAAVASVVAHAWGLHTTRVVASPDWFAAIAWLPVAQTVAIAVAGPALARLVHLKSGAFLLPLCVALLLSHFGMVDLQLPPWLLVLCYAAIGVTVGLRFTRPLLVHAGRALPRVLLGTLALLGACGLLGALLVPLAGVDPLTAYLATSPGGADSVAIIAASTKVDVPFVLAMQTMRLLAVMSLAPMIARLVKPSDQ
jgi:uncharacterized protein